MNEFIKCYRIECIGNLNIYEQYQVLECFKEIDDIQLFHRFNTKLCEIRPSVLERLKNEFFKDYCDGILYFLQERKEMLLSKIMDILNICKLKYNHEDTVEDLYRKLLLSDKEVMSWLEIDQIKLLIFEFSNYDNFNISIWEEERIIFRNKYYMNENGIKRSTSSGIWYNPQNAEEVIKCMEKDIQYSCIIINKDSKFIHYSYALRNEETADNFDLVIYDKCKCFYKNVVPRLLKLDKRFNELIKLDTGY